MSQQIGGQLEPGRDDTAELMGGFWSWSWRERASHSRAAGQQLDRNGSRRENGTASERAAAAVPKGEVAGEAARKQAVREEQVRYSTGKSQWAQCNGLGEGVRGRTEAHCLIVVEPGGEKGKRTRGPGGEQAANQRAEAEGGRRGGGQAARAPAVLRCDYLGTTYYSARYC